MSKWITNCLEVLPGTLDDYHILSEYHYRTEPVKPVTQIYKIVGTAETKGAFPDPMAVIVYRMPLPDIRPRHTATKGYFKRPASQSDRLKLVNEKIQYIARLIVDPRFHRRGLASILLKDSLERQNVPIIETLTPIDFTNKIFQKAGFKLFQTPAPPWYRRLTDMLFLLGLTEQSLTVPLIVHNRISSLQGQSSEHVEKEIHLFLKHYRHRESMPHSFERTEFILSKLPYPQAYLIWFNPRVPAYDE